MKIVFFDGYCVLCNGFADWLLKQDQKKIFFISSLQGATAREKLGLVENSPTIIYLRGVQKLEKSSAVLGICRDLGGFWRLAGIGYLAPRFVRDGVYDWVARNRYDWFGRRESCRLPTKEEAERFLA